MRYKSILWPAYRQKLQRALSITMMVVCVLSLCSSKLVHAEDCSPGWQPIDCAAVFGPWVEWDPLDAQLYGGSGTSCGAGSGNLSGSDNIQKGFNFFKSNGLSDVQAAAVDGNLALESRLIPTIMQKGGFSKDPRQADPLGWGIAQWTPGSKVIGIAQQLNINTPIYQLSTQLNIVLAEMKGTSPTGYNNVYAAIKKISNLAQAVQFFQTNFEGGTNYAGRYSAALDILNKYGGGSVSGSGGCGSGMVDCSGSGGGGTNGLSQVRQNVVCLTEHELSLWNSGQMKAGTDFEKYSQGNFRLWCADFASWIYNQANYPLQQGSAWSVPAVSQIEQIGRAGKRFHYHAAGSYTPVPGDLVIHTIGESHVNIVVSVNTNTKTMRLIGGDQRGSGGAGGNVVNAYVDNGFSGTDGISGYVSPD